jgi:ABC-type spermidine/putrescine transport system permease subunit I
VLLIASQFVFLKGSLQRDVGMGVLAPGLTLENFREIFTDPYFVSSLWLSFSVSTVAMVITLLIAFPAAYVIARMQGQLSIVLLAAVVVSSFLSIVVKVLGLLLIFSSSGPLNKTLFWLGVIELDGALEVCEGAANFGDQVPHLKCGFRMCFIDDVGAHSVAPPPNNAVRVCCVRRMP